MGQGTSLAPAGCNQHPRGCTLAASVRSSHSKIQMRSKDLFPGWVGGSARAVATGDVEQAASHGGLDGSAAPSHPPCPAQELKEAPAETRQMVQSTRILNSPAHDVPTPGVPSCISPSFINSAEPKKTQGRDGSSYCQPRPSGFLGRKGKAVARGSVTGPWGQAWFQKAHAGLLRLQNFPLPLLTKDPQLAKQWGFGICKEKQFVEKKPHLRYQPCNGGEHLALISPPHQQ